LRAILRQPRALAAVLLLLLGTLLLTDGAAHWSKHVPGFWMGASLTAALALVALMMLTRRRDSVRDSQESAPDNGVMFGALVELARRPGIGPVLAFILLFKLGDSSMGFMVKPFWVDAGFTAAQIGMVSVNLGLVLSIAGGLAGGWYADRVGLFKALWVLGLAQALSNLGYALAAWIIPLHGTPLPDHRAVLYLASALESFTGGLGTAAFLAFLMAIVRKEHGAAEYALLSSIFAASRSIAGWAGGIGAQELGYAPYFLLTFFLSFPAYVLLPWVNRMLQGSARRAAGETP
jgi:PAT family beta-lactamase induction signal transducer AmpG